MRYSNSAVHQCTLLQYNVECNVMDNMSSFIQCSFLEQKTVILFDFDKAAGHYAGFVALGLLHFQ